MRPVRILEAIVAAWRRRKWVRLTPQQQEMRRVLNQMSAEERAELDRWLADDSEKKRLDAAMDAHRERQRKIAEERERRGPEVQAAHAARMKALADECHRKNPRQSDAQT